MNRAAQKIIVAACIVLAGTLGALAGSTSKGASGRDVVPYLKAYIHQDVTQVEGHTATAPVIADDEINGLKSLGTVTPQVRDLVKSVLRNDFEEHQTEYIARDEIAQAEAITHAKPFDRDKVQEHLWSLYFNDPRWLRRILKKLELEATKQRLQVTMPPIPPEKPLTGKRGDVTRVYRAFLSWTPENPHPTACDQNPIIAFDKAAGYDPILAAAIFEEVSGSRGSHAPTEEQVVATLKSRGWTLD